MGPLPRPVGACEGSAFVEQGEAQTSRTTPRPLVADDQPGRAFLRAVRRRVRRFMRWLPPPVCGPAFGSCSGGASGGDAWASASDTVNTSAGGTAMVNPASPRRESALRREITSDVLISNLPDFGVGEKADNRAYRGRVADQGPGRGPLLPGLIEPPTHALSNRRAAAATDLALSGSRSYWYGAYPFSGVTRGLDPRVHPRRKSVLQRRWIAGSSPAMNRVSSGMISAARPRARFDFHFSSRSTLADKGFPPRRPREEGAILL
jgi:hypothetical protein